jgi:Icc-related predicted phosphoesterase
MRVAAVADVHSPKYLDLFKRVLAKLDGCDIFLLCGDLVVKNDHTQLPSVVAAIRDVYQGEIVGCFGNEEYPRDKDNYKLDGVKWLDDDSTVVEAGGMNVGIVGTRGALDRPTFWQRTHIGGIGETYHKRVEIVDRALAELRADVKVVISHYAPTYATLEGEREQSWPEMSSKHFEDVIKRRQPDAWFHGHIHRGKKLEAEIGRTLVVNTSLPARGRLTVVELPRKTGLEKFV